mmetsp:Transcript_87032/g.173833  ORF Transcript_87032/g.173833 Transcript_87032/m.173833 type:complete len:124 (-) Transcript_87032:629-1000(-)
MYTLMPMLSWSVGQDARNPHPPTHMLPSTRCCGAQNVRQMLRTLQCVAYITPCYACVAWCDLQVYMLAPHMLDSLAHTMCMWCFKQLGRKNYTCLQYVHVVFRAALSKGSHMPAHVVFRAASS